MQALATKMQPALPQEEREYYLYVDGEQVPVSKEVYREYYKFKDKELYIDKVSRRRDLSTQFLDNMHVPWEYQVYEQEQNEKRKHQRLKEMRIALEELSDSDRNLIIELFFEGKTEVQYALEKGVTRQAVNERKLRILENLKKMIEISEDALTFGL